MHELINLTIILFSSLVAIQLSSRIGIPAVVGQLLVGIFIGPALLNWVKSDDIVSFLSEIGVILLMFLAGLEANLSLLKKYIKPSLLVAITGVLVPLLIFYGTTQLFGYEMKTSFFYGIVFAATSVSITVEVLQEYNKVKSDTGAVILDAAVADDILAVLLLSFFVSSTSGGQNQNLLLEFGLQVLFFIFLYFLIKYLIPGIFRFVSKFDYFEKNSFLAVIICFSMAILADKVGMSAVIGSFFAGLGIGQLKIADKLTHEVAQFSYLFFIPIFFASIALPLQLDGMLKNLPLIVLFTVLAVLTKLIPSYLVARGFEFNRRNALTIGGGMVSRGEMALIIVQLGLSQSLISKATYSTLVIVVILTTLIAPFLLKITFKENKN